MLKRVTVLGSWISLRLFRRNSVKLEGTTPSHNGLGNGAVVTSIAEYVDEATYYKLPPSFSSTWVFGRKICPGPVRMMSNSGKEVVSSEQRDQGRDGDGVTSCVELYVVLMEEQESCASRRSSLVWSDVNHGGTRDFDSPADEEHFKNSTCVNS
ncbi:uncharacterized protein BDZ83DRAFT_649995 [Colletotrichum acutatum]|uniref:Uncharacterized protein n=1 Tax=Glomerella acutata TaxID=27357 RepID=A0AAD8UV79_GLOAC|nr:uncharacterized protein BDZ83DRAFT_649995 [Colletotrichum acutatum]KAK1726910.1 hypothetical protein BDZ83DRAFT_649995 [Colletotrichum acutatum]